jgi:SAM-dependent methyltransferase
MSIILESKNINGIECYSPEVSNDFTDYPNDGFYLTDKNAAESFWVSSRTRIFSYFVQVNLMKSGVTNFFEIGCGTGDFIGKLKTLRNLKLTGSEIYVSGLHYAKKRLPDIKFIQYDVTKGVIGEKFNLIAAFDVIEHIEEDEKALSNIYNMLPPGGRLIVSVPQYMFLWSAVDDLVMHKRRYSKKGLVSKLLANGFKINRVTSFVFIPFPLMLVARLLDKKKDTSISAAEALENRVVFPKIVNSILDCIMKIDELFIRIGINLPFGGTLIAVAEK